MSDIDREALARSLGAVDSSAIHGLRRLSGGASQETWSFDLLEDGRSTPLILRRAVGGRRAPSLGSAAIALAIEAELIRLAGVAGVPVPGVRRVLTDDEGLGEGFVMERIAGETIPRRILREPGLAAVRPHLARQCGEIAARIHSIDLASVRDLPRTNAAAQIEQFRAIYQAFDHPRPVFELAFRWLGDNLPDAEADTLVHGDFRNGNLIIGERGVHAVLDWELAHTGDPMEDLGWICVNSWRFGELDNPVGGFGTRDEMFAGYEAVSGRRVDPLRVRYWEVFGTLKWGVICMIMYGVFRSGLDRSVERAAIGRRASETEIDLLTLLSEPPLQPLARPVGSPGSATTARQPSAGELVEAARVFLEKSAMPELEGRTAFHARVAVNALAIVGRELELGPAAATAEHQRLAELLGSTVELIPARRELCRRLRDGEITLASPGVANHLWRTTLDQIAIDQPGYETYRRLIQDAESPPPRGGL